MENEHGEYHQHQSQEEIRNRQAEEADECCGMVADRVLVRRSVDADGNADQPGEQQAAKRNSEAESQPVAEQRRDGPSVEERMAHVAREEIPNPNEVLNPLRLVQTV